eukprot:UN29762
MNPGLFFKWFADKGYTISTMTNSIYAELIRDGTEYLGYHPTLASDHFDFPFVYLSMTSHLSGLTHKQYGLTWPYHLSLTYRKNEVNSVFYPRSTWGQGRNTLIYLMLKFEKETNIKFNYFITIDGDLTPAYGDIHKDW